MRQTRNLLRGLAPPGVRIPPSPPFCKRTHCFQWVLFVFADNSKTCCEWNSAFSHPLLKGVFPQGGVPMTLIPEIAICPSECANLSIALTDVRISYKLTCPYRMAEKRFYLAVKLLYDMEMKRGDKQWKRPKQQNGHRRKILTQD